MSLASPPSAPIWSAWKQHWPAKALYAALFCLAIPAALVAWAAALSPLVPWPAWHSPWLGVILVLGGVTLMLAAFDSLRRHGCGLPMNAFPPPIYVSQGSYRWMRHPIYAGFCLAAAGAALATGSRGGTWVVTPMVILGCTAVVLGYERPDLERRFGEEVARHRPLLHFPADGPSPPGVSDRVSVYVLILLPWLILYYLTAGLPTPPDAFSGWLRFERGLPVLEWTEIFYASAYVMVLLAPPLAKTRRDLRLFAAAGTASMAIVFPSTWPCRLFRRHAISPPSASLAECCNGSGCAMLTGPMPARPITCFGHASPPSAWRTAAALGDGWRRRGRCSSPPVA